MFKLSRTIENPDLEELRRYNRDGCSHDRLPGALRTTEVDAIRGALGDVEFLRRYIAEFCQSCQQYVPTKKVA